MTIVGGTFRVGASQGAATVRLGLAGADLGGHVVETGRRLAPDQAHVVASGSTIAFPGIAAHGAGARAYLAIPGGVDVPEVLGSRSTSFAAGFGGLDGRALRSGDMVVAAAAEADARGVARSPQARATHGGTSWPASIGAQDLADDAPDAPIRVIRGPSDGIGELVGPSWHVAQNSDRVGLRLDGATMLAGGSAGVPSFGVVPGTIQIPPDGAPIVLLADAQTTGGYPVVAVAIAADMPRLAQLRPGSAIRFEEVSIEVATAAARRQRAALDRGAALLHESSSWDQAWQGAGG
jgi:antagonist of KipI